MTQPNGSPQLAMPTGSPYSPQLTPMMNRHYSPMPGKPSSNVGMLRASFAPFFLADSIVAKKSKLMPTGDTLPKLRFRSVEPIKIFPF